MKRTIKIDLDVHRRIEAGRKSFDENENAILRRLLGLDTKRPAAGAVIRAPRSSGAYSILLGELPIEANSLKELLRRGALNSGGKCRVRRGLAVDAEQSRLDQLVDLLLARCLRAGA